MTTIPAALAKDHGGAEAPEIGARWAATLERDGGLKSSDSVLDVGCGPGRMALAIGERFGYTNTYVGFDVRRKDIEWCAANITARHPGFRFSHLDVRNALYNPAGTIEPATVTLPDGPFDFIFATSVFTHMRTAEMLRYLAEARRVLRPGGHFLASYFCVDDDWQTAFRALEDHSFTARPENPEESIGYRTSFVLDSFARLGFTTRFYRGTWSRIEKPTGQHTQDYVVATAPPAPSPR